MDLSFAKHLLDLGCGFGFMGEALARRAAPNAQVVGVDAFRSNREPFLERVGATGRSPRFVCMELDSVRVKGKSLPVKIYQLVGENDVSAKRKEAIRYFQNGLELYKKQNWDEAIQVFQSVITMDKDLYAADLYIQRTLDLKANPPGPDWNGVFVMTTK